MTDDDATEQELKRAVAQARAAVEAAAKTNQDRLDEIERLLAIVRESTDERKRLIDEYQAASRAFTEFLDKRIAKLEKAVDGGASDEWIPRPERVKRGN